MDKKKNRIIHKTQKILIHDPMLQKSTVLFIALMAGNLFGYLFQLSMGRMLSIKGYGDLNALMSLMVIFGIPFQTLINFFAKNTAVYSVQREFSKIRTFQQKGLKRLIFFLMPLLGLLLCFSNQLVAFLSVSTMNIFIICGCVFFAAMVNLNAGVIQGLQHFYSLAVINCGTHFTRFIFGIFFVWIGMGVTGAVASILMAGIFLFVFSQWRILKTLPGEGSPLDFSFINVYHYARGLFFANLFFGIMTQADIMLVKHFFSSLDAGLYTSAAVLGKAVLYLPGAIVMAMFPMVASNHAAGASSFGMLCKALLFSTLLSGAGALLLFLFPDIIVSTLYGEKYLPASSICGLFGVAMLPVSLVFLMMNYLLALGKLKFIIFMGIATLVEVVSIYLFHDTLSTVLYAIMAAGMLAFVLLFFVVLWEQYQFLISEREADGTSV